MSLRPRAFLLLAALLAVAPALAPLEASARSAKRVSSGDLRALVSSSSLDVRGRRVRLSSDDAARLRRIAQHYHQATKRRLVVTGGARTSHRQAELMVHKLERGENVAALYGNKKLLDEIITAYQATKGKKLRRPLAIREVKKVIDAQMARGEFVSGHLTSRAVDIRSHGMSPTQERAFRAAVARESGVHLLDERSGGEPHFHLTLSEPQATPKNSE